MIFLALGPGIGVTIFGPFVLVMIVISLVSCAEWRFTFL
jgi:hypothetical protein